MSITTITAHFLCDGCGKKMDCELDEGSTGELFVIASQSIADGSYQGQHHLCDECTKIVDAKTPENPTYDQVHDALSGMSS